MGGGPSGGGQSSTIERAPGWVTKYGKQYLPGVFDYLTGTGPQPSFMNYPFPNQQVAGFTPDQQAGMTGVENTAAGQGGLTNASDAMAAATLGGKYLDPSTNPFLTDTYNTAAQNVVNQYKYATAPGIAGNFAGGGGLGGSAMGNAEDQARFSLGQNLDNLATNIYGGNYQQERQNQMSMENMLPTVMGAAYTPSEALLSIGGQQQGQQQNVFNTGYQNAYNQANFPFQALDMIGSAIGQMGSMGGASTTFNSPMGGGKGLG